MMYYSHNLHFIAMCPAMNGNYLEAKKERRHARRPRRAGRKEMPPLEGFMTLVVIGFITLVRWVFAW